ncbi:uncharacterized protein LOC130744118 [Lotus japonicus]|uniref:uncharacterized protein LOC130744118 n=1 Tax=Lotus japonicus TaxID=34305 RepID=UPI00258487C2|nr:uncharacterized protein LOC130744118 [Lotus japonicus]
MAAETSGDPNLLRGSDFGDGGRVTLKQHPTFEENQGRSVVRKRALALDNSKSPDASVKKSKLSSYDDEDDADDILDSLEREIEYCTIALQNKKKKVACIRKINEVYKKMQKKIEDCVCDFVQNETLHGLMEDLIRERELQLKTKEEELDAIKKLIDGQAKEHESERKKLDRVISERTFQEKKFDLMNNQIKGRLTELGSIQAKLEVGVEEFKLKEEEFSRQAKDLESKRKHLEEQLQELKLKEKQLIGQEKELELKNKHFEGQVKVFELKKEKFESQAKELKSDERREKQNELPVKSFKEENELDEPELPDHRILVDLEATSDPAKVVLDIIQKPIVPLFKNKEKAFIMDSSHIFLLKQLLRISPHIKPCVRVEAMKLALDLEGNMRTSSKNPLEILGFLLLLSIYGLVPFFDEEEVLKLLKFAGKSSDFIQNLVKKEQHIEAVRFICAFKLADKNQPVDLLWDHIQNAKLVSENTTSLEIQDKARDQEVATLTNVLLSISDNKLESEGLLNEIQDRILELNRRNRSSVCTGTWSILKMCNNLRKRNVGSKCGRGMEPSESKSAAAVSYGDVPQQQQLSSSEPSPHAHPQSSDLNHAAKEGALGGELQNKFDFKGADEGDAETREKDLDFNDQESGKGEGCAEDCLIYMKTGSCKFGSSCRFNHSIRRRSQAVKEKAGEATERSTEVCRNYQRYGVCKYGKACWYIHTRGNSSDQASERSMNNPATETNVRQKQISVEEELPERPGEPECQNYLKTGDCKEATERSTEVCKNYQRYGFCKFGKACRYIHTRGNSSDQASERSMNNPATETNVRQKQILVEEELPERPGEPECRNYLKTGDCKEATERSTEVCRYYQRYGVCKYGKDCWYIHTRGNSFDQASERSMTNPATETNDHQKKISEEEFPERSGEPECRSYLETGDCKSKSDCLPLQNLSDKGLPLRPDQNVCSHYSCKFESACKYPYYPIMAAEASGEPNLLTGSDFGIDDDIPIQISDMGTSSSNFDDPTTLPVKRPLDNSESSHNLVKKSKLSSYDDDDDDGDDDDIAFSSIVKKTAVSADHSLSMLKKFIDKELALVERSFEECQRKRQVEEQRLHSLQMKIEECVCDFVTRETLHNLMEDLVRERELQLKTKEVEIHQVMHKMNKEREGKEEELEVLCQKIAQCTAELKTKEEELDATKKLIDGHEKELQSERKKLLQEISTKTGQHAQMKKDLETMKKQLDGQMKELESMEMQLEGREKEVNLKEKEFVEQMKDVESKKKHFESLMEELKSKEEQLEGRAEELELKEKQIKGQVKELESKEEELVEKVKRVESKEKHFESLMEEFKSKAKQLEGRVEELELKDKQLKDQVNEVESKEGEFVEQVKDLESKTKHFESLKEEFVEQVKDMELKKKHFESLMEELISKEEQLEGRVEELELKEKQLKGQVKELESKEEELVEKVKRVESKEKHSESLKEEFVEQVKDMELKKKHFESLMEVLKSKEKKHEDQLKELMLKEKQLIGQEKELESKNKHFDRVEKELKSKKKQFEGQVKKFELKEKKFKGQLEELESKQNHFNNQAKELESKKKQLEGREEKIVLKEKQLKGQTVEFESKEEKFVEQVNDLESNKKHFESLMKELKSKEKQLEGLSKELNLKEKQLEDRVKEFELKMEKFEIQVKELKSDERSEKRNEVSVKSFEDENELDNQFCPSIDGRSLQFLSNEKADEPESFENDILANLKATSDPSKLVLDIIQNPLIPTCAEGDNAVILDSTHIVLLEQLMQISPHVKPHVREEAMKLAIDLKANMRANTENSSLVLCFLLLLSIYGLLPCFGEDDVLKLFEFAAHHKQSVELFRNLGFADKVPDFVQTLIKKQQHIEAVRFICEFKLADQSQPVDLLREYTQNAKLISESCCRNTKSLEIKDKARDQEIATLKSVLQCISDNNLDSEGLISEIHDRITELNRQNGSGVYFLRKRNVVKKRF